MFGGVGFYSRLVVPRRSVVSISSVASIDVRACFDSTFALYSRSACWPGRAGVFVSDSRPESHISGVSIQGFAI
jgi:hypothetical protein